MDEDMVYEAGVNDALLHNNELQRDQTKLWNYAESAVREMYGVASLPYIKQFVNGYNAFVRAGDEREERRKHQEYIIVTPHPHEGYRLVDEESLAVADKFGIPHRIYDYQWPELVRREDEEGYSFVVNECVMSPKIGYGY